MFAFVEAAGCAPTYSCVVVRVRVTAARRTGGCRGGGSDASTRRTSVRAPPSAVSSASASSTSTTRVAVQSGALGRQRFVGSRTSSHSTAVRSPSPTPPASRAPASSTAIATVSDVERTSARSASARATTRSATKAAASTASTAKVRLVVVVVRVAGGGGDGDPAPSRSRSPLASRTRAGGLVDSGRDTLARRRMVGRAPSVSGAVEPSRQSRWNPQPPGGGTFIISQVRSSLVTQLSCAVARVRLRKIQEDEAKSRKVTWQCRKGKV